MNPAPGRPARWPVLSVLFGLLLSCVAVFAQIPVPPLAGRVNDLTGTLTPEQRLGLEARLAAIEQRKGAQVAVLIVESTAPETIEAFGIRVVEAWKLGRGVVGGRRVDDGVLLLIATGAILTGIPAYMALAGVEN